MADRLVIQPRGDLGMVAIMARKGVGTDTLGCALGVALPDGPMLRHGEGLSCLGVGPGSWLAIREGAAPDFAAEIAARLAGSASVSDQSSGYSVTRLSGEGARRLLQRGVAIDLDPAAFAAGSVATTLIAHIGVILWQVDDAPTYDIATFRSFADSFSHWLEQAAAALPF